MATDAYFSWTALSAIAAASTAVVVVTNTLRRALRLRSPVVPFVVSLLVAFAAAAVARTLVAWPDFLLTFLNACLLYCTATGAQETVVEGAKGKAETGGLQSAKPLRWFSSWLRDDRI